MLRYRLNWQPKRYLILRYDTAELSATRRTRVEIVFDDFPVIL